MRAASATHSSGDRRNSVEIRTGCAYELLVSHAWCYSVSRTVLLFVILPPPPASTSSPTIVNSQSISFESGIFNKYSRINYFGS